jgi:hypothetical protein
MKNKLTIGELEEILEKYKISKPRFKNAEVESKSLPSMLNTFRVLIKDEIPPTQEEFINEFKKNNPDLKLQGIVSRLKRAYLSFVREYHLGFLLDKYFDKVIYDEDMDLAGIDYIIKYKNINFNLHAFVDTSSGRYWRSVKNKRHEFKGEHIDLPLNLSKGKRVGKFIMYTDNHIVVLINEMSKIVNERLLTNLEKPSDTN